MKKKIMALLALSALLLTGCAQQTENRTVALTLGGERIKAVFDGMADMSGGFTDCYGLLRADKWSFEGVCDGQGPVTGTAKDMPAAVTIGEAAQTGVYSGAWEDRAAHGEGVFIADDGAEFRGTFAEGKASEGEGKELSITLEWQQSCYTGTYSGTIRDGMPDGRGDFAGENPVGLKFSYSGEWRSGAPGAEGTAEADRITVTLEGEKVAGEYSGTLRNGVPEGEGTFSSVNSEDVSYTYTGAWKDGAPEGEGTLAFAAENYYVRQGTFTAGSYTPTGVEALAALGSCEPCFTLSEAQREFLSDPAFWEREDHTNYLDSPYRTDARQDARLHDLYTGNADWETPAWTNQLDLRLIVADHETVGGREFTCLTAANGLYTEFYRIIVPGRIEGLRQEQFIYVIGLPIGWSTYTNTLGEEHSIFVVAAGDVLR